MRWVVNVALYQFGTKLATAITKPESKNIIINFDCVITFEYCSGSFYRGHKSKSSKATMVEHKSGVEKLREFLKEKFPQVDDKEIEEIADNLLGIGFFITRFKRKQHSTHVNPQNEVGFRKIMREPP